jgi:hypothetical protein
MAMGGGDVMALAFTIGRLIAQPLQRLRLGFGNTFGLRLSLCPRRRLDGKVHRGEGLEKGVDHPGIDWIGRNILADGGPILLPQVITDVAGAALLLDHHLVAAFATVDQAV